MSLIKCGQCAFCNNEGGGHLCCHLDPPRWALVPGEGSTAGLDGLKEPATVWQVVCIWPEVQADTTGCSHGVRKIES